MNSKCALQYLCCSDNERYFEIYSQLHFWIQSGHKVTIREIVSTVNCIFTFNISVNHTAYLNMVQTWFFPQLCEVSRELLCEKMAYQHIMLFQLEIIL